MSALVRPMFGNSYASRTRSLLISTMSIPIELLLQVAEYVRHDQRSLSLLCQLNSSTCLLLTPILYNRVNLSSQTSMQSFCDTIATSPRKLGGLVHGLKIGVLDTQAITPSDCLLLGLRDSFRDALIGFPNLRHLSLMACEEGFDMCFRDFSLPFKLETFEVPCLSSQAFYDFLSAQPTIVSLHLLYIQRFYWNSPELKTFFSSEPKVLPNLNTIAAPLGLLASITPGRQISHILVDGNTYWSRLMCRQYTNAPTVSIGYYDYGTCKDVEYILHHQPKLESPRSFTKFTIIDAYTVFSNHLLSRL